MSGEQKERHNLRKRGDLDPEQVRQGREEEMNYTVKTLGMFEFGSWQDATSKAGKCSDHDEVDRSFNEGRQRS